MKTGRRGFFGLLLGGAAVAPEVLAAASAPVQAEVQAIVITPAAPQDYNAIYCIFTESFSSMGGNVITHNWGMKR
jgi:hypothetical protein